MTLARLGSIAEQVWQHGRDYLPRHAELVPDPAAHVLLAVLGKPIPEAVNLTLSFAVDYEGYCRGELEHRASILRCEGLAGEFQTI